MIKVTKGSINYYGVVHGFSQDANGLEYRLILCCDEIGDDKEQVKAVIGNNFFEIHSFDGYANIFPISALVSVSMELKEQ